MRRILVLALLVASCADACGNECSFGERCAGDVLEICGEGPDQFFGREVHELPCDPPNTACVDDERGARCVVAPPTACDASYPARCEGEVALVCPGAPRVERAGAPPRHVTAIDCGSSGSRCVVDPRDGPVCRAP